MKFGLENNNSEKLFRIYVDAYTKRTTGRFALMPSRSPLTPCSPLLRLVARNNMYVVNNK